MTDDLILLASAYLDGDVTADERALVESDPELLGEVERLRSVRIMLGAVEPSSISVREQHLAAALGAWDTVVTTADSAPTPLDGRRRRRSNSLLLGAAAAIMVVFAGGVALQTLTGGESTDEASFDAASTATAPDQPAGALAESNDAAGSQRAETSAEAASPAAESADTSRSDTATDGTVDTGISDPAPPSELELEQLSTPAELGIFASDAVDAPEAPQVPAATSGAIDDKLTENQATLLATEWPLCLNVDYVVGPALYQGTEVVVGVDTSRDLALAYRAANCREVARAPLP
jgi:hypothetical protein